MPRYIVTPKGLHPLNFRSLTSAWNFIMRATRLGHICRIREDVGGKQTAAVLARILRK